MSPTDGPPRPDRFSDSIGVTLTQCAYCFHRASVGTAQACKAFPNHIPDAILRNAFDHREPWPTAAAPEDQGVRFEPRPDIPAAALAALNRDLSRAAPHG